MSRITTLIFLASALAGLRSYAAEPFEFREQELPTRLQVGYAVRLLDMNEDGRLDIAIVDSKRILWLENANWNEHVLIEDTSKTDNVCFAPYDIDRDGRLDFAVGADWTVDPREGGTIQWITGGDQPAEPWKLYPIGTEPTVHRMRFADLDNDGRDELFVLPLMGRNTTRPEFQEAGVRILSYRIPDDPIHDSWTPEVINDELHVTHNFWFTDLNHDKQREMLVVSFEGVSLLERDQHGKWKRTLIGRGDQQSSPNRGASEIKIGQLANGTPYIATIEPWHGNQVVVYTPPSSPRPASGDWLWNRLVLDDQLKWGHAVWCANLDGDDDDELIIGVRDQMSDSAPCGIRIYDPVEPAKGPWKRTLIDGGGVAVEDLAAGDLNQDGRMDIVAVGRSTHNVKIYWGAK